MAHEFAARSVSVNTRTCTGIFHGFRQGAAASAPAAPLASSGRRGGGQAPNATSEPQAGQAGQSMTAQAAKSAAAQAKPAVAVLPSTLSHALANVDTAQ